MVSSTTHAGLQLTSNCIERIGVSSSSGCVLVNAPRLSPLSACWQNCLAVRVYVFHLLTWYMVLWMRRLRLLMVIMSSGMDVECCGDVAGWVGGVMDLLRVYVVLVGGGGEA